MADPYTAGANALVELAKLIASKDDRARAEIRQSIDLAIRIVPMGTESDILKAADRITKYIWDEGAKKAKLFAD